MRSISRITGASTQTIMKILVETGSACAEFHDRYVRGIDAGHVQCDEIWSFCYAKKKNVDRIKGDPEYAGDVWTWTAIDSRTKLIISWLAVPGRGEAYAETFLDDLRSRVSGVAQISTDGLESYKDAVPAAFGKDVNFGQMVKSYEKGRYAGSRRIVISGDPREKIGTPHVERQNLTMRMSMRRFTRSTNGFSKKFENHKHNLTLYFVWYNFCREHMGLGSMVTPAMAAGLTDRHFSLEWLAGLS